MNERITGSKWYASVPEFHYGYPISEHSADERSCIAEFSDVGRHAYYLYIAELEEAGFKARETYTLDRNVYALYDGESATVYTAYSAEADTVRLYAEEKGSTPYPVRNADADRGNPVLWQLPVDYKGFRENGGMKYVIKLTDGTFMLIDGGYPTEAEADTLYNFLKENTPDGKEPVITAWFLTHLHGDHFGAIMSFADKYAEKVDVKGFYYHLNPSERPEWDVGGAMAKWKNAVLYCKMHTGMEFRLPGVKINIIQTQEDLYPLIPGNYNDASMVFSVTVGEQRILFLGDSEVLANGCMLKYQSGETLKSDIVQYSHHGYLGCSKEFYDKACPHTILWPMNIDGYQEKGYSSIPNRVYESWHTHPYGHQNYYLPNRYISYYAPYVKKVIIHNEIVRFDFPYAPTGERLPDFKRLFDENTADFDPKTLEKM